MANLSSSAVTVTDSRVALWGNYQLRERTLEIVLSGQGTAVDGELIPASALGFNKIVSAKPGVTASNAAIVVAFPSLDKANLLLKAADSNLPATYTGVTLTIDVTGDPVG